ncbi:hypothetical protein TDB9533_03120 [Thalassocella blandensis]|nr:hypothetical protein TDB9533_03120 [Thalassocella blandensis]
MPSNNISLALAFLETQPEEAASVLEMHDMNEVAEFFTDVPFTYAGPVLEKMLPRYAAKLCYRLSPATSAAFLSQMKISLATSILRHAKADIRKSIFDQLPEKTTVACKLLLTYAEDMVGAWMETQIVLLPVDLTVGEAKQRLLEEALDNIIDTLYVVDREKNYLGNISAYQLLMAKADTSVSSLMCEVSPALHGRSSLLSVKKHEGWDGSDALPVFDRNNHLIGTLRHLDLRKGLNQLSKTIRSKHSSGAISEIGNAYGKSLLALLNSASEIAHTKKVRGR